MQFGLFSVGDVTPDPTTGRTPTEAERITNMTRIALKAEEVGLDVFASGEHHNPPFVPSSPTTLLGWIAARTETLKLSTATTLITTNDPVKIAEDYAMLQHLSGGRVDLMMGRGNTGPVYPWFGKDIRKGIELAVENYHLLRRLWREPVVDWQGEFRTPLQGYTSTPAPLDGVPPFVWHGSIRSPEIAEQAAFYGDGFFHNHIFWNKEHTAQMVGLYRRRFEHYGHGSADQAIVGLGGQAFMGDTEQAAVRRFRPYFDNAPVYGHGPSLEDFTRMTPLTVGTPEQVIERTLGFADYVGDYQRQLFLLDHAGLPLDVVLEQVEILGREVVPTLRADWSSINSLQIRSAIPLPAVPFNWHTSYYYELGVTRYLENGWSVSAGYVFNQSAMPDGFYNPVVADVDKHFFSVGTGYQKGHWSFDVAYQLGYGPEHNVQGSASGVADGKYSFLSHALSTTVGYHF